MLSLKGRVDFTCLKCLSQTHFASAVGHELVDSKRRTRSFMEKGFMSTPALLAGRYSFFSNSVLCCAEGLERMLTTACGIRKFLPSQS